MIVQCWKLEKKLRGSMCEEFVGRFTTEEEARKSMSFLWSDFNDPSFSTGIGGKITLETIEIFDSSKSWRATQYESLRLSGLKKLTDPEKQALGLEKMQKSVNFGPCGKCNHLHKDVPEWGCCLVGEYPVGRKEEDVVADCEHFGSC